APPRLPLRSKTTIATVNPKHTVKEGKLKDLARLTDEFTEFVEANEPRLLAIDAYLNDDRDRLTLVQIHADLRRWTSISKSPARTSKRRSTSSTTTASTCSAPAARSR